MKARGAGGALGSPRVPRTPKEGFGEVEHAAITLLVDNKADLIVKSTAGVKYFEDKPLLAEHGFSALIRLGNPDLTVLWDAGGSRTALPENMRRLKIDPATIQVAALSHGHWDHVGALIDVLSAMPLWPRPRPCPASSWKAR